jgi:hypothetical protein
MPLPDSIIFDPLRAKSSALVAGCKMLLASISVKFFITVYLPVSVTALGYPLNSWTALFVKYA